MRLASYQIRVLDGPVIIQVGSMSMRMSPFPLTVSVMAADDRLVQDMTLEPAHGGLTFPIGTAAIVDLGSGASHTLDLSGRAYPIDQWSAPRPNPGRMDQCFLADRNQWLGAVRRIAFG
jgi:hypothetical protein